MSYTKTDMLSHKIIEILKEHSDEKHPLTQQQICGYLEEKLGIKPNRKTVAQHLKSIIGDESCNVPRDLKPVQYKNLNRYMLDGTVERVHINIKKKDISLVLDTFGNEFTCNKVIGNDDIYDVTFRANIQTAVRWAIANRKAVKLTSPKRAVDIVKEEISALSEMYGNQER